MTRYLNIELVERLLFTVIIVGLLAGLVSVVRLVDISMKINNNSAAKIHRSGEQLNIQSTAEGRGLVASDVEYRRLVNQRASMFVVGGVGLALIGFGWLGYDLIRSRQQARNDSVNLTASEATAPE